MSGIHDAVLQHVQACLLKTLLTDVPVGDPTRAGLVKIGPHQGDPSPDEARIVVTLYSNDPDGILSGAVSGMKESWEDAVEETEIGGAITHVRRFTVKGSLLFVDTAEVESVARSIASTVRERIETALLNLSFCGVVSGSEYVARGCFAEDMQGEMLQAGGPPDAFQYTIKVRFSVLTTRTGVTNQ